MARGIAKKLAKNLIKSKVKKLVPVSDKSLSPVKIKFGRPVLQVTYGSIKFLTGISLILLIGNIFLSLKLFANAVNIRNHLGVFINMVSKGDGEILPMMQAMPVLCFLIIDTVLIYLTMKLFDNMERKKINLLLFIFIMIALVLIIIILVLVIFILTHAYHPHEKLHNGIVDAMKNYSGNSVYKRKIDRLQIEFQCCGSKKYDEWYNITWYDTSLLKKGETDTSDGNTPFSCCSISSIFPCIHHNIEKTGKAYLYTPEQNLSISTNGCYNRLREKKQEMGWEVVGNLFLFMALQGGLIVCLRLLQTGHSVNLKFVGHSQLYTVWIFGCYAGKKDVTDATEETEVESPVDEAKVPPEPPPIPEELKK